MSEQPDRHKAAFEACAREICDTFDLEPDLPIEEQSNFGSSEATWKIVALSLRRHFPVARSSQRPSPSVGRGASISEDGPHKITDDRRWLARQLLDSKLSDDEAFGVVAFHPAIKPEPATVAVEGEWVTVPADPGTCELDDSGWLLAFMVALHARVADTHLIMGWADFDDEQRERIKSAYRAMIAAAPKPTLPAGEWTDEQVEAAAFAARSARHRLYAETPAKYGSAHSKEQMDGIEIAAFRAALATITPAGGRE